MVYERKTGNFCNGGAPSGMFGQISLCRLCETLENCGEVSRNERITHLEIYGNLVRYRVETREKD